MLVDNVVKVKLEATTLVNSAVDFVGIFSRHCTLISTEEFLLI